MKRGSKISWFPENAPAFYTWSKANGIITDIIDPILVRVDEFEVEHKRPVSKIINAASIIEVFTPCP